MSAPAAAFFYLGWHTARLPALPRSCCSLEHLACGRQSCTPVCLHTRGLVPVLLLVVAPGVRVVFVLAAATCAALCCCLPGVESGHLLCCTGHLLEPLAVIAPVSAIGLCLFLLLVCVCSCYWFVFVSAIGLCLFLLLVCVCFCYWLVIVPAIGLCLFLLLVCVCSCIGACFPGGCCGVDPVCSLPQLRQLLFWWVTRCSCRWELTNTSTTFSNTVS